MGILVTTSSYLNFVRKLENLSRILYFVGKICSSIAFAGVFIVASELYPTKLRLEVKDF